MEHIGPEPWRDDQSTLNDMVRQGMAPLCHDGGGGGGGGSDGHAAVNVAAAALGRCAAGQARNSSRLYSADQGRLTLGLLPLSAISNGHTYFVQHPHAFCAPPCSRTAAAAPRARPSLPSLPSLSPGVEMPLGVHTTFQFGDSAGFAYGKRERMRQAGLWRPDLWPRRARRSMLAGRAGARLGLGSAEVEGATAESEAAPSGGKAGGEAEAEVKAEAEMEGEMEAEAEGERYVGFADWEVDGEAAWGGASLRNSSADLVRLQLRLDWTWRGRVLQLLLLASALNRTALLPPLRCHCDLAWTSMTSCRQPGAEGMALPFECPLDHLLDLPRWHTQRAFRWRAPRHLQHRAARRGGAHLSTRRLVFGGIPSSAAAVPPASRPALTNAPTTKLPEGLDDDGLRAALAEAGEAGGGVARGSSTLLEVALRGGDGALCGFRRKADGAAVAAASRLLRFTRLFCFTEGADAGVVHGAPCCTPHSLPTGWMADGDPRGDGYFPCAWGFATPAHPPAGAADGSCHRGAAAAGSAAVAEVEAPGVEAEAAEAGAAGAVLMCCVMPEHVRSVEGEAEAEGVREVERFVEAAVSAGIPASRIQLLSPSSAAVAAAASRLGARLVPMRPRPPIASGTSISGWAAVAASCVEHAAAVVERGRVVVLSTAQVCGTRMAHAWHMHGTRMAYARHVCRWYGCVTHRPGSHAARAARRLRARRRQRGVHVAWRGVRLSKLPGRTRSCFAPSSARRMSWWAPTCSPCYLLLTTHYSLLTTYYSLLTTHY